MPARQKPGTPGGSLDPAPAGSTPRRRRLRRRLRNPAFMLAVGLVLVLLGGFGAGLVKTAGGSITVRQLRWETGSGHELAAELFIPKNATPDHPAPAIACSHGWQVNSEYQEAFYIEFARRGYVVVAIDMYGHGDSDAVAFNTWWSEDGATGANGLYDAVQMLATLPFVDADQIGVTGHSNGGTATNLSVLLDNEAPAPLIDAALIVANEPLATRDQTLVGAYLREDSGDFHNPYGGRDVGVIAGQYDEVFHRFQRSDGTVDPARDFVTSPSAQSFLHFGADPAGLPERSGDTVYRQTIDGREAVRVIYNPTAVHNLLFIAPSVVADAISFFDQALPAPRPLPAGDQIAPWKPIASAVGAAGLMIVFVSFFLVMLRTRYFGVLAAPGPVAPAETTRRGRVWLWAGLTAAAVFSMVCLPVMWAVAALANMTLPSFFDQHETWTFALWSLASGLFTLLVARLTYRRCSKAQGLDLRAAGVILGRRRVGRTVILGVLAAAAVYALVFLVDWLFRTDVHVWLLFAMNRFDADKLGLIIKFVPFFWFFFTVNSVAMNVFNYLRVGRREWLNTLLMALFNTMGVIGWLVVVYAGFFTTGHTPGESAAWGLTSWVLWLMGMLVILPAATVGARIVYKATRNPYLPAVGIAILVTCMLCTRTLTVM